jgi:hypothetical protein
MGRDTLAESALRDAVSSIVKSGSTYGPIALSEAMRGMAELALIAKSDGTLTRAAARERISKAIDAIVTAESDCRHTTDS